MMAVLAFVLVGTYATGTYAVGGLMVTVYTIAQVCAAPFAGRLLDRLSPVVGSSRLLGLTSLVLAGLAAAVFLNAPAPILVLLVAFAGALPAGTSGAMRSLLSQAVPQQLLASALAIDATVIELVVVSAPLVVLVVSALSPPYAVVAMACVTAMAALLVRGLRGMTHVSDATHVPQFATGQTLWHNPRFIFWLVVSIAFGHALGTAETCALPLSRRFGSGTGGAAGLVAALAVTSALSGVAYAGLTHRFTVGSLRQACVLLAFLVAGSLCLGLAPTWITAVGAMVALGACTAPLNTVRQQAAEAEVPPARRAEAFGILYSANGIGYSLGGLTLALLPLSATLIAGGISAIVALGLAPFLFRSR